MPLEGTLTYEGSRTLRTRAPLLVPPDHEHAASCDGVSLCVFIPPEAREGRLRGLTRPDEPWALDGALAGRFAALGRHIARGLEHASPDDHARMLEEVVETLARGATPSPRIDARVLGVLEAMDDRAARPLSQLAGTVGLSRSHLAHRVKDELGVSLSRLALFRKLMDAHRLVLAGVPLSAAASDAGFSDHAHFSRTTRRMLGQSPAFVAASAFKTAPRGARTLGACTPSYNRPGSPSHSSPR